MTRELITDVAPFGIILYYLFTFVVMVILLNVLIALYNQAYTDITENATDEYLALVSHSVSRHGFLINGNLLATVRTKDTPVRSRTR